MRLKIHSPKISKHRIMYLVHHVKIINIRNYESFEIRRQSESDKYLWWWGTLSGWWSYPDNEHSLKKMWDFDNFENNVPSSRKRQHRETGNVNMLGLVSGFCLLNIFIYLFMFIQIISYSDNFINNKCKQ